MRTRLPLTLCLLLLSAPAARAAGLDLAWDKCLPDGGVIAKRFACANNTGYAEIIGSFIPMQAHPRFVAYEVKLDIQSQSSTLPAWWQLFNAGSCRENAFSVTFDFRSLPQASCNNPFEGTAMGGVGYYATSDHPRPDYTSRPNAARMGMAVAMMSPRYLSSGTEYYAFDLRLEYDASGGAGACEGCSTPACLTLSEVTVYDDTPEPREGEQSYPPAPEVISQQAQNNMISWQDVGTSCQSAVKNKTWGQLKSMYR